MIAIHKNDPRNILAILDGLKYLAPILKLNPDNYRQIIVDNIAITAKLDKNGDKTLYIKNLHEKCLYWESGYCTWKLNLLEAARLCQIECY